MNNYCRGLTSAHSLQADSNPRTSRFYRKSKIPGRPEISLVNFHSSKISEHVDYHLKPTVSEISSYIKEINIFLRKWKPITKVQENLLLVTLDEKLLYTSIPNCESIKAHKNFKKKKIATKVITTFLTLILTLKKFILNSKYFL